MVFLRSTFCSFFYERSHEAPSPGAQPTAARLRRVPDAQLSPFPSPKLPLLHPKASGGPPRSEGFFGVAGARWLGNYSETPTRPPNSPETKTPQVR